MGLSYGIISNDDDNFIYFYFMKTYVLKIDESQQEVIDALVKALKIEAEIFTEADEDVALSLAMEEGKKYGRLSENETNSFLDNLGK
jgi:2-phospho-L-lactate transferase/gluconeogenesis factor (CofD/UPF0052 family)